MGLKQDSGARIESRRQSWDPDKTAELRRYGGARTGLQQLECKTMTEVCRRQWRDEQQLKSTTFLKLKIPTTIKRDPPRQIQEDLAI